MAEEIKNEPAQTQTSTEPKKDKVPEPKWLFYILSAFFYGIVGIVLGIIYMKKESEELKKFGKTCLTIGIIFMAIPCVCTIVYLFFMGGLALLGNGTVDTSVSTY